MKYLWNETGTLTANWHIRVYHDAHSNCLRNRQAPTVKTGDTPPSNFYPCARCYPPPSKRREEELRRRG